MNITSAIETVIRNHENCLISNGFEINRVPFTSALFTNWMRSSAEEQRKLFYNRYKNPYKIDVFKLCYLFKYMPSTTASMNKLVDSWPDESFREWIEDVEKIGICSLGSGPGSDVFGGIFGLLNKTNHNKKIRYVIRKESVSTWEHFYQNLKKELITEDTIDNIDFYDNDGEVIENTNETVAETLKNCYDEWISNNSAIWSRAHSYSKCNVLLLQHVISDPTTVQDEAKSIDRFELVIDDILSIIDHAAKPLVILISDRSGNDIRDRIGNVKTEIEKKYALTILKPLRLTGTTHIGFHLPDYLTNFNNFQANYNHYQTIWKIEEKDNDAE